MLAYVNLVPRAFPIEIGRGGTFPAPPNFSAGVWMTLRVSPPRAPVLSRAHYFQAPATQAVALNRIAQ